MWAVGWRGRNLARVCHPARAVVDPGGRLLRHRAVAAHREHPARHAVARHVGRATGHRAVLFDAARGAGCGGRRRDRCRHVAPATRRHTRSARCRAIDGVHRAQRGHVPWNCGRGIPVVAAVARGADRRGTLCRGHAHRGCRARTVAGPDALGWRAVRARVRRRRIRGQRRVRPDQCRAHSGRPAGPARARAGRIGPAGRLPDVRARAAGTPGARVSAPVQ